jgi:hemolysin activation/secretion protein
MFVIIYGTRGWCLIVRSWHWQLSVTLFGRVVIALTVAVLLATTDDPPAKAQSAAPATAAPEQRHFDISEFRVEGNTVLTELDIDRAVYDFLGPDKTAGDVEKARAALESAYTKKGYPTVSAEVPVQRVTDGVVVLKVTERPVGRLRVHGSRYYDLADIKAGARSLAEGKVPHMPDVQRDIIALNQWPDRGVTPSLRAGVAPDTVDVDLQVQDQFPAHATLELNNRQSQDTTPLRLSGSLGYDNLWQRGDSATVTFQVAPQDPSNAEVVSGSYLFRIPDSQLSLLASFLKSNSDVTTLGSTSVIGKGEIGGLRLLVPLGTGDGFVHTLSTGMDYKHFDDNIGLAGSTTDAPITYYPTTLSYQATWSGDRSQTNLVASVVFTFDGLGSNAQQFDFVRFGANPGFAYLRIDANRTQTLPLGMQLYGHLTGQLAGQPLISNEQFALGGLDSVRGYLEAEVLGDYGGALQTELRSPSLSDELHLPFNDLRALAFFDVGTAVLHSPLPGQQPSFVLASTGVGVRLRLFDHFNSEVLGAFALSDGVATKSGEGRVLFRVYGDF